MMLRFAGAALLMAGCGGFGYTLTAAYRRELRQLRALLQGVQEMEWELKYRLTELPGLCRVGASAAGGELRVLLRELADRLDSCAVSEISGCLNGLLEKRDFPPTVDKNLRLLGQSLGRFDLEGQVEGLRAVQHRCRQDLQVLEENSLQRQRSCRTLALCAGAALAILLL